MPSRTCRPSTGKASVSWLVPANSTFCNRVFMCSESGVRRARLARSPNVSPLPYSQLTSRFDPMNLSLDARAGLALALLAVLTVGLLLAWRWFERDPGAVVQRVEAGWLRRFAAARFARGGYLGLHLTIGLLVSLAGLALFANVTEDVVEHERLTQFDVTLLHWMQAHATPLGRAVFSWISDSGSFPAMAGLALAGCVLLAARRRWIVLTGWAAAFGGGGLLDGLLKLAIRRPRPPTLAG